MRFLLPVLAAALAVTITAPAAQFNIGPHNFTLPDGFTIEVAAPPTLAPRPIEADFDEQGRLYVTDSSGSNDKVAKQLADKPHRILRLEDSDGDGVFDKSVVFADRMMFPEGCLWHDGSLYVSAPPSIWKLTDTNNDGVADVRVEWFKGNSLGGCANDLHGPYLGPDGWIYWCKGGFERQTNILWNGKPFVSRASHIYRARPDGTGLEPIMTGGMDNPVGLAWSAEGELFLSGTFFQHPGGGKRDGIIHVLYGGVYGKENDVLEGHPRTGDLLPMMTHLGPAAPCGMMRYESPAFGSEYQNNLFVCNFNLHRISRHILKPSGSTFTTVDSDFLVSDNTDFHPTDVFEDPDGSLLVVDTGGWYKLCCPTSQLSKPDVLGSIYRIRRKDAPKLTGFPSHRRAVEQMVRLRSPVAELTNIVFNSVKLNESPKYSEGSRLIALEVLSRMNEPAARKAVVEVLRQWDPVLNFAALHAVSLMREPDALKPLMAQARSARSPGLRVRLSIEALGRLHTTEAVPTLLETAGNSPDRALEHALIYSLIEIADPTGTAAGLKSENPEVHRISLIALDQMPGGNLKPEQVTSFLTSTNAILRQTAHWIVTHHPEWAGALAGFLKERLTASDAANDELAALQPLLVRFARDPAIQQLLADAARSEARPARLVALRAIAGAGLKRTPPELTDALKTVFRSNDRDVQLAALAAVRSLPDHPKDLNWPVYRLAWYLQNPPDIRLQAYAAVRYSSDLKADGFKFALQHVPTTNSLELRSLAANLLSIGPHSDDELHLLTRALPAVGPVEFPKLLAAYHNATNEAVGLELVDALQKIRSLQAAQVRPNLTNFPATVRTKAEALLASLNTDAAKQKVQLDELATKLGLGVEKADVRRGQALFNGQKAACSTCHAIGYLGGNLGPDLTRIGTVRTERDLLESIVFPSASFVRSFEPLIVVTKSGDEHSGILRRDAPDEVVLATGPTTEERIARADILEMRPGTVSVMPQGLDQQLTRAELADLLAFLKATKW